MRKLARELDRMIRRRLRVCIWKAWKTPQRRLKAMKKLKELFELKTSMNIIKRLAYTSNNYAKLGEGSLGAVIPNKSLEIKGLISIEEYYINCLIKTYQTAVYGTVSTVVWEVENK